MALFHKASSSKKQLLEMTETRYESSRITESIEEIRRRRIEEQRSDLGKGRIDFLTMTGQVDATIDRPVAVDLEEKGLKSPGNYSFPALKISQSAYALINFASGWVLACKRSCESESGGIS